MKYAKDAEISGAPPKQLPSVNNTWMWRWRFEYCLSKRIINLRWKVPFKRVLQGAFINICNVFRLRFFFEYLFPGQEFLVWSFDETPMLFNSIDSQETLELKGAKYVRRKLPYCASKERFTHFTSVSSFKWPFGDSPPPSATLFKGKTSSTLAGITRKPNKDVTLPRAMLLQFQECGSYREEDVVEFLEWALPVCERPQESIYVLLDCYGAHDTEAVRECVEPEVYYSLLKRNNELKYGKYNISNILRYGDT